MTHTVAEAGYASLQAVADRRTAGYDVAVITFLGEPRDHRRRANRG